MAMILNGQVGWHSGTPYTPPASTLWTNIYAVYNADSTGSSSLKTSLYAAYNGESNANDSFGSNNGTAVGGVTYTAGKIGNAFTFNGTNAYVSLSNTTNQFDFTGDFSISLWFNQSVNGGLFSNCYQPATTNRYGYSLYVQGGRIRFQTYKGNTAPSSASNTAQSSLNILINTWYHVVITKKVGNAFKMYINGVLQALAVLEGDLSLTPVYSSLTTVNIGAQQGSYFLNGKIDAVNIWQKELTATEVTDLYNLGNGSQYITDNFYKPTTNDALNTYNGTAQGGLTYGVGKVGTAFQFNGTNSYVNLGDVMDIGTSSWSYGMWFNVNNISSTRLLFSKAISADSTGRVRGSVTTGGVIRFAFSPTPTTSTDDIDIQTTNTISLNTWYHVVFVLDRTNNMKIYLNGVLQPVTVSVAANNLIPYSALNFNNTHPFRIGAYTAFDNTTPTNLFSGSIDAFNVWNRVLTQSEITELYNSGNGKQYPN